MFIKLLSNLLSSLSITKLFKMYPYKKITKEFTKKFGSKDINRQYFYRKTGLNCNVDLKGSDHFSNHFSMHCTALSSTAPSLC